MEEKFVGGGRGGWGVVGVIRCKLFSDVFIALGCGLERRGISAWVASQIACGIQKMAAPALYRTGFL